MSWMMSLVLFSSLSANAFQDLKIARKGIALVYNGVGACPDGCSLAAANAAKAAGFTPKIVGPEELAENATDDEVQKLFKNARVWIQPGGYAKQAYLAMTQKLRKSLVRFIHEGGGYVGFCAGAFLTTKEIGDTGHPGLGIFPGKSAPYVTPVGDPRYQFSIEPVSWFGMSRQIYFEQGPYLYDLPPSVEVVALYKDGRTVAAARTHFGEGKVFISGPHPEAPQWWSETTRAPDLDGTDLFLAIDMIRWAGERSLRVATSTPK